MLIFCSSPTSHLVPSSRQHDYLFLFCMNLWPCCFGEHSHWSILPFQASELCQLLPNVSEQHHNKLYITEVFAHTDRGMHMLRRLSFVMLQQIILNDAKRCPENLTVSVFAFQRAIFFLLFFHSFFYFIFYFIIYLFIYFVENVQLLQWRFKKFNDLGKGNTFQSGTKLIRCRAQLLALKSLKSCGC